MVGVEVVGVESCGCLGSWWGVDDDVGDDGVDVEGYGNSVLFL